MPETTREQRVELSRLAGAAMSPPWYPDNFSAVKRAEPCDHRVDVPANVMLALLRDLTTAEAKLDVALSDARHCRELLHNVSAEAEQNRQIGHDIAECSKEIAAQLDESKRALELSQEQCLQLLAQTPEEREIELQNIGAVGLALHLLTDDGRGEMLPGLCADALAAWRKAKAQRDRLAGLLRELVSFPGVADLLSPRDSLSSLLARIDAALKENADG